MVNIDVEQPRATVSHDILEEGSTFWKLREGGQICSAEYQQTKYVVHVALSYDPQSWFDLISVLQRAQPDARLAAFDSVRVCQPVDLQKMVIAVGFDEDGANDHLYRYNQTEDRWESVLDTELKSL